MSKKLLIVESPNKIKTISKFLGKDFKVMSTVGHIKDLPAKELGVSIDDTVSIKYVTLEGKEKVIADICKEAQKSQEVFLAPDPDREGEIIAWHIEQEVAKVMKNPDAIKRITFNEITKPAIEAAITNPSEIDAHKVAAQQARRVLDRVVGYEVSPVLWKKVAKGLSAGRVQSVALKMIVEREEAIRSFKQEEYWSIETAFQGKSGTVHAMLYQINKKKAEIANQEKAEELSKQIKDTDFQVTSIKDTKRLKNALPPFMTSTLQQAGYNQLGFSVQKTMQVAQKLYEGMPLEDASTPVALITYMRTDSLRISDVALKQVRSFISSEYGKDYLPTAPLSYSKAKAQDAHEAIRPIDVSITPEFAAKFLTADAAKVYSLIWRRFVASQMKPAQYAQRQVTIAGGIFTFRVTGSSLIFDGFLKVYGVEEEEEDEEKTKGIIPKDHDEMTFLPRTKDAYLWNVRTGQLLYTFDAITSISFNDDGTKLVTTSAERGCIIWDVSKHNYFDSSLSFEQILLLYLLYELFVISSIKESREVVTENLFEDIKKLLNSAPEIMQPQFQMLMETAQKLKTDYEWKALQLDVNMCPHLKVIYTSLPDWIQTVTGSYVKKDVH